MTIKLVALDMDGTLLNSQNKILPSTKKVITQALDRGIKIVLTSGRPIAGLKEYLDELKIPQTEQYVVTLNGAITRSTDGSIIDSFLVNKTFYEEMTKFGKDHHVPFNIVDPDSRIITADTDVDYFELLQAWENNAGMFIRKPSDFDDDFMISKGGYVGDKDKLDEVEPLLRKEFGQDLYIVRADDHFLELLNPNVNKGNALHDLGEKIGISSDEMAAFGDEKNDISMFNEVGTAICMENGSDEAKSAATYITDSNDEDGIAHAFEKYIF